MKYCIAWTSKENGNSGHGEAIFTKEEAEREAVRLAAKYPFLIIKVQREKRKVAKRAGYR